MSKTFVYSIPRLCSCKGDLTKSWYVYFYFTDPITGIKKKFRYKYGLNYYKTKRDREHEAGLIKTALHLKLQKGWNPFTDEENEYSVQTVSQAFDNIIAIKKSFLSVRSYKTYVNLTNLFKEWLKLKNYDLIFIQDFTQIQLQQYFDYLLRDKKYCGKTHNNHLSFFRSFFNSLLERGIIKESPVKTTKQVKQETGKNTTYSTEEQDLIEKYLLINNKDFYYVTRFIKYCFLRRSELSGLKIKHINWKNKTISIPSDTGKARNQDSVTIPNTLETHIMEMGILNLNPELYVFGKRFIPSVERLKREDDFTSYQAKVNKLLKINEYSTFYSWKHTGVVELYNLTKDPYTVMRQCRHSDVSTTMIYLRSLGCGVNEQVRGW